MTSGIGSIPTAKQKRGQSASKCKNGSAVFLDWLLDVNCWDYLQITFRQVDGSYEFFRLPHRHSEKTHSFPCLPPTPCCVLEQRGKMPGSQNKDWLSGQWKKTRCLGDDSRLGQGGSLLSSYVTHGNTAPKARGNGWVWQHTLPLASRATYDD